MTTPSSYTLPHLLEQLRSGTPSETALAELRNFDLTAVDLSNCNLSNIDLSGVNLFKANLQNCTLFEANLEKAELTGANLTEANLTNANCQYAGFGHAIFSETTLFQADCTGATFTESHFEKTDARCAIFKECRAYKTHFLKIDCTGSSFYEADLSGAIIEESTFNDVDLRNSTLKKIEKYETSQWIGVDIRDINFAGAYRLRRFINDENYINEFKNANKLTKFIYYIWWLSSDCGRSIRRWSLLVLCQLLFFAFIYTLVDMDFGTYKTWLSPFYNSVATMTTLGYGDIIPKTVAAELVVIAQVLSGYVMLGGLLAILTNKLSRRAD